jgi:acetylornithine/N-succinyldiaminopimelate aminotransferase
MSSVVSAETELLSPAQEIMNLEREYLLQNYARYPLALHRGKGCYVYDLEGNRYLDLISGIGVNSLGYAHPRITKVIRQQCGLLLHTSNLYYHEYQGRLAQRLAKISGLSRSFFCNSGTEAMEGALKMIRAHGNAISHAKTEIIALDNSAGIVLEFIQGEGGIYPVSEAFARRARELANQHDALLVLDEIQCGVGRPGAYFAYQLLDPPLLPDVVIAAKPMGCGLPLGTIIANEKAAAAIKLGMHGSTYGGGPLACRVAIEFFDILEELLPSINAVGGYFRMRLTELMRRFSFIKEVRGQGLMIGVELEIPGKDLVLDGIKEGLLFNCTHEKVLRLLPPYILTEQDVDRALTAFVKVLRNVKPQAAHA